MSKRKAIIFGTGKSAKCYSEKYANTEYEIIGITDWDYKKHGEYLYGFKVINPYDINKLYFDHIVIAAYYIEEIKKQFLENVGDYENKMVFPEKYKLKGTEFPFANKQTVKFGFEIIAFLNELANKNDFKIYADFGTLLGLVRDGVFIEWDDDIDLSVNEKDKYKFHKSFVDNFNKLPDSDKLKWTADVLVDDKGNIWYYSIYFSNIEEKIHEEFELAIGIRKRYNNQSVCMRYNYYSAPEKYFVENDVLKVNDVDIVVPKDYKNYLEFVYGEWEKPVKYSFNQEYGNINDDSKKILVDGMKKVKLF